MAVGWAVLGTGSHVTGKMVPAFARANDTRLAAVYSRSKAKAEEFAHSFGFARAYDSFESLLKDPSVDAVYVCTPHALHAEQTIQAARAGKHVLVEKPMALTVAEAEAMVEAAERAGVRLGVGFHVRHHPAQKEVGRLMAEGQLGDVLIYEARWAATAGSELEGWRNDLAVAGGYVMMSRGVHVVDLLLALSGKEPVSVSMVTDAQAPGRSLEETALATMHLGDEVFATMLATRRVFGAKNSYTLYGTKGLAEATGTIGPNPTGTLRVVSGSATTETSYSAKDLFQEEIEAFNRSVLGGKEFHASGEDGLLSVRVTVALFESARTGLPVRLR